MGKGDQIRKNRQALAAKTAYVKRKESVMEREKTNDRLIIIFHSDKTWWKIAGKSVVYYEKLVAPRLKRRVSIWPDNDYGSISEQGIINVKNIETFVQDLKDFGYKEVEKSGGEYRAIDLGYKVTPEEYNSMAKEDEERWEMSRRLIMPAIVWPGIKAQLMELLTLSREATRHLDATMQRVLGDKIMAEVTDMVVVLNLAAHAQIDPMEGLVRMEESLDTMDGYMMSVIQLRVFKVDKAYNVASAMLRLRKLIEKEIVKEGRKNKRKSKKVTEETEAAEEMTEETTEAEAEEAIEETIVETTEEALEEENTEEAKNGDGK